LDSSEAIKIKNDSIKMNEYENTELDWRKALLPIDATLQQAVKNLNETTFQIAIIVTPDNVMIGILTDGDIRRGLLQQCNMNSSIEPIVQREPLVVPPELGRDSVLQLMQTNRIHQLPIVDKNRRIIGLHLLDELMGPRQLQNLMVIMAGGQGTRLRPHTKDCPKPMLSVNGKPMLVHIIEKAKADGFQRFVLAVHYLGNVIEEFCGDGSRWNVQIDYLREESPLGTAGALSILNLQPDKPFVVSNADLMTDINYGDILDYHNRHAALATMAVRIHKWQHPYGVVHTNGVNIIGFEEKPILQNYINAGIYVLDPDVLSSLKRGEHCDMPELFGRLQGRGVDNIVYPMHEPWIDVGRLDDLKQAQSESS
jgi:dTDP-glucose pyrophosphorylase